MSFCPIAMSPDSSAVAAATTATICVTPGSSTYRKSMRPRR
jgi:hypothetical protein